MARAVTIIGVFLFCFLALPLMGQNVRLWVLRAPGEMTEYDPGTFAHRQTVKVLGEAVQSPQNLSVNVRGQMLFSSTVSLPLSQTDAEGPHKVWFWDGQKASSFDQGVSWKSAKAGSNLAIAESAPRPYLAADGKHLFWFANQAHRLQREDVDLSTATTWLAWQTDLSGGSREQLVSTKFPECKCGTGSCEESCAYGEVWVPPDGVANVFLMTQPIAGQTQTVYNASTRYQREGGAWNASQITPPLHRILDAASSRNVVVEAIPDSGCCGWVNQSNDQTLLRTAGKTILIFDESATYKNPDYDVSFYTSTARVSPELGYVAMNTVATAQQNRPIQLAEQGQADPQESRRIHKALAELPAVEVKSAEDSPRRIAYIPHAALVGWMSEKELLVLGDHLLVAYNVATGARRKSAVRVDDAAHVFLVVSQAHD